MKICLVAVNARFSHSNPALYSIYYYVKEQLPAALWSRLDIRLKVFNINQPEEETAAALFAEQADIYAFSVYIWNALYIDRMIARLKGMRPEVILAAGGAEVDYDAAREYERQPLWDYVCRGEGESEYLPMFRALAEGEEARAVFTRLRQAGCAGRGPDRADSVINEIPFFYPEVIASFEHRIIYYESSRGCPFHCTYCVSCLEPAPVYRAMDKVLAELDWFIGHEVKLIKFLDRSFNFPPERACRIWAWLIERCAALPEKQRPCFHFELEASLLDEASAELLLSAPKGLFQFELGIQSIHASTLRHVRRKPLREKDFALLRRLIEGQRQAIHLDLIAGLPGETAAEYEASYNYCWQLWPDMLQAGHLKLLRGTPLKTEALQRGYRFNPYPPYEVLSSDGMSAAELIEADLAADMTDRYYNRRLLPELLPLLPGLTGLTPYQLMLSIGRSFQQQRGEHLRSVSQAEHYIFLMHYLQENFAGDTLTKLLKMLEEDYEKVSKPGSLNWSAIVQKHG